jgi:WD40 repeat protein
VLLQHGRKRGRQLVIQAVFCRWLGWGKLLSGSADKSIPVWDVGTGAHDAKLTGFDGIVYGLAVHRDLLFSSSRDCTIRVWELGTWTALQAVEIEGRGMLQYSQCLAVSGSQLISWSWASGGQSEVQVWGADSLELQHMLLQPGGADVWASLAVHGGVWAGLGRDVVVWGRGASG